MNLSRGPKHIPARQHELYCVILVWESFEITVSLHEAVAVFASLRI